MPMNIVALQKQLEGLPDQTLSGYMQQPSSEVPQYLVLSEMNRRKQLRQSAAAMQAPQQAPKTTVADDVMSQGVMSLPQNPAPQGYAEGGLVSFANGGDVDSNFFRYDYGAPTKFTPEQMQRIQAARAAELAQIQAAAAAQDPYAAYRQRGGIAAPVVDPRAAARAGASQAYGAGSVPFGMDVSGLIGRHTQGVDYDAAPGEGPQLEPYNAQPLVAPGFTERAKAQADQGAPVRAAALDTTSPRATPRAGGLGSLSASARTKTAGGVGGKGSGTPDDLTYNPQSPEEFDKAWRARAKGIREEFGDEFAGDRQMLKEAQEELAGRKAQNINQAMIQAGLGMMAGKSQHAFVNIGEGGLQGLQFLQKAQQADGAEKRALMQAQMDLNKAEGAARRGDQQTAIQLQGQVEKDRQFAVQMRQQRENYMLAHQDRLAQINATLQAASMRVSQGSGTKSDALALKAAQMAETTAKNWAMANKNNPEYVINPEKFQQDYQAKVTEGYTRAYAVISREVPGAVTQQSAQPQTPTISFGSLK